MFRGCVVIMVVLFLAPAISIGEEIQLTLEQGIAMALKHNPSIEAARQQCLQSNANLTQARADYLPQVRVDGSYGRQHIEDLTPEDEGNVGYSGVSASQLIYDFGKTGGGISASRFGFNAANENFLQLQQNVILDVKQSYYSVLEKRRLIEVSRQAVENYEQQLYRAREYFKAGVRTRIDVTNAQVELSNARLDLLQAKSDLKTARVSLEEILGVTPNNGDYSLVGYSGPLTELAPTKPPMDFSLDTMLAAATENRPALRQAKEQVKSAEATIRQAQGDYFPSINANAGYDAYDSDLPNMTDQWQVNVGVTWNIFSGLRTKGAVAEARGKYLEQQANLRDLQLSVTREVTESYLQAEENSESVDLADETLDLAAENLQLAEERYKAGLNDMIEFNDAQLSYTRSQSSLVSAYYDYLSARARIEYATGVVPDLEGSPCEVGESEE
jgi:outer membrane protein